MRRINASIMALIITITTLIYVYKPSDHAKVDESPTTSPEITTPVVTVESVVVEESPPVQAESPEVKSEIAIKPTQEPEQPQSMTFEATFYTATCEGCSGITKLGYDVRRTIYAEGYRVIAVDPKVIPLDSIVSVTYKDGTTFNAIAADIGGDIKGRRIDVLVLTEKEAYALGRQQVGVTIIKNGEGR